MRSLHQLSCQVEMDKNTHRNVLPVGLIVQCQRITYLLKKLKKLVKF